MTSKMHLNKMLPAGLKCAGDLFKVPVNYETLKLSVVCAGSIEKRRRKKKSRHSDEEALALEERLTDTVTPLWRLCYEEQLQWKQEYNTIQQHKILLQMTNQLSQDLSLITSKGELPFPVLPTVRDGYCNKSTFSVNKGVDGNPKTVEFYIGTGKGRDIVCIHGDHLLNMPSKHNLVASMRSLYRLHH